MSRLRISLSRRRLYSLSLAAFGVLLVCACSNEVAGESRDEALQSKVLVAGKARQHVAASSLVDSPETLICVLRPYQEDARPKGSAAVNEINRQLVQANYVAGDGHWALVAYESGKPIRVAVIQQGALQMARAQKELCEPAAQLRLAYNSDGQVTLSKQNE
jgi:hypothetical protein